MHSQFITFTFDPKHEANPEFDIKNKSHWQNMIKRLRKNYPSIDGQNIKYFRVGEHGDKNGRWHYHIVFFHLPKSLDNEEWAKLWRMGFTRTAEVNVKTITYVAKYTATAKYHEKHNKYNPHEYTEHSCSNGLGQEAVKILADLLIKKGATLTNHPTPSNPHADGRLQRPHTISYDGITYIPTRTVMNKFVERFEEHIGRELPMDEWYDFNKALDNRRDELSRIDTIRQKYQYKVTKHKLDIENGVWKAEKTPPSEKIASNPYLSEEAKNKVQTKLSLQDVWTTTKDPPRIPNSSQ